MQDPTAPQRHIAVRIRILPKGTVFFENILPGKQRGVVDKIPENLVSVGVVKNVSWNIWCVIRPKKESVVLPSSEISENYSRSFGKLLLLIF